MSDYLLVFFCSVKVTLVLMLSPLPNLCICNSSNCNHDCCRCLWDLNSFGCWSFATLHYRARIYFAFCSCDVQPPSIPNCRFHSPPFSLVTLLFLACPTRPEVSSTRCAYFKQMFRIHIPCSLGKAFSSSSWLVSLFSVSCLKCRQ